MRLGGDGASPGLNARVARARGILALGAAPGPVRKYELQQMTRTEWRPFTAALRDLAEGGTIGESVVAGNGRGTGAVYLLI